MKQYMEVGEVGTFDKKRYKCVEDKKGLGALNCITYCDIHPSKLKIRDKKGFTLCNKVRCWAYQRKDGKAVHFELVGKSKMKEE